MKQLQDDWTDDPFKTVGDYLLCAWATGPCSCRIQTSSSEIAKKLRRLPDCTQVGFSVSGTWVAIFAMPYTLDWVGKNVVEKFTLDFPRKNSVQKLELPQASSSEATAVERCL